MDLKKLFEEISKLSVEEQKLYSKFIEVFLKLSEFSHTKGYTEKERIEWLSNLSGIFDLIAETYNPNKEHDEDFDDENQMKR
ncbi:MAG: hypothetical protein ACI31V_02495 [Bacilli bacterium]